MTRDYLDGNGEPALCGDCCLPIYYEGNDYHHAVPCDCCFALPACATLDPAHPALLAPYATLKIAPCEAEHARGSNTWTNVLDLAYAIAAVEQRRCFVVSTDGIFHVSVGPIDERP